ncbi:MAG: hypothetical protein AAGA18_03080 [Verrucomicrobiota bacterium]
MDKLTQIETDRGAGVTEFIASICKRLNQHRLWNYFIYSCAAAAVLMVLIGASYLLTGHEIPKYIYGIVGGLAIVTWLLYFTSRRITKDEAAAYGDRFFNLKDSLVSCRNFAKSRLEGEVYDLQARRTVNVIKPLSVKHIAYQLPRRSFAVLLVLGLVSVLMAFKGPSESLLKKQQEELETERETAKIKGELEKLVKDLEEKSVDNEERDLIKADRLKKWVQELKSTKDREEALRQYALLERKLNKLSFSIQRKKDEQLLNRVGTELARARESKELGEMLRAKRYRQAAQKLKDQQTRMKKQEDLSEKKRQLEQLKTLAQRMASASDSLASRMDQGASLQNNMPQMAKQKDANDHDANQKHLKDLFDNLKQNLENADQLLSQYMDESPKNEQMTKDFENSLDSAEGDLRQLSQRLQSLSKMNQAKQRLENLRFALSGIQGEFIQKLPIDKNEGPQSGKLAGNQSIDSSREAQATESKTGLATQLKGAQGTGPSLRALESANQGSGTVTRVSKKITKDFEYQVESFIQREDVPQEVRQGVKSYFENIHQGE